MKKVTWFVLLTLLVGIFGSVALFWDQILYYVAPKAVLSQALTSAFRQLDSRFEKDPFKTVASVLTPDGIYNADIALETTHPLLGATQYNGAIQWDSDRHKLAAQGKIHLGGKELDTCVYLDGRFMALSSADLASGDYYGITYDTFEEDVRNIPLLSLFIPENKFSQWNASVQKVKQGISINSPIGRFPDFSDFDWSALALGIVALPCQTEQRALQLNQEDLVCHVLSYQITAEQLRTVLPDFAGNDGNGMTLSFYLYERALVYLQILSDVGDRRGVYALTLGTSPVNDTLQFSYPSGEENVTLMLQTDQKEDQITQTLEVQRKNSSNKYQYQWIPSTQSLRVTDLQTEDPIYLTLIPTQNGFRMESLDFSPLWRLVVRSPQKNSYAISGWFEVEPGSEITTPDYKNLSDWSLEDFLLILETIGSFIGIQIGI